MSTKAQILGIDLNWQTFPTLVINN